MSELATRPENTQFGSCLKVGKYELCCNIHSTSRNELPALKCKTDDWRRGRQIVSKLSNVTGLS